MISRHPLAIDPALEMARITGAIEVHVRARLRRRGVVVGLSGGVDSSVVAALCARALGCDCVLGLLMPERDGSDESLALGRLAAESTGIPAIVEPVGPVLEAAGCYRRQRDAIREIVPDYDDGWRCKLALPPLLARDRINVPLLIVQAPTGETRTLRPPPDVYRALVAATSYKQRVRKMTEYHHADRLGYAVAGTPNRVELDQGFFVKQGDGAADLKPIAHLYKTQVYALAEHMGVPEPIRRRPPTTDTYSLPQTQEEFYFALPFEQMDVCLFGHEHGIAPVDLAPVVGLAPEQVARVYRDIEAKRRATRYLHTPALMVEPLPEVA